MIQQFKAFVMRGNVLDLAVGIVIGAAFGKIVTSFVADILMPVLSLGMGKVDFSNMFFPLDGRTYQTLDEAKKAGVATVNYGLFANVILDFLIVAFAIFLLVRAANKLHLQPAPAPAPANTRECPDCAMAVPLKARKCGHCLSVLNPIP